VSAFVCVLSKTREPVHATWLRRYANWSRDGRMPAQDWQTWGRLTVSTAAGRGMCAPDVVCRGANVAIGRVRLDNRQEIRSLLKSTVPCQNDLALAVAAYTQCGENALGSLAGDFAFVIWNETKNELLAVRDIFGVRQLFYADRSDHLAISPLASQLTDDSGYDAQYVHDFIVNGINLDCRTIFADVRSVPAAHLLCWQDGKTVRKRYWSALDFSERVGEVSAQDIEEYRYLLAAAVRSHCEGRRTTWSQLSGGLDSSTIVSMSQCLAARGELPGLAGTVTLIDSLGSGNERQFSDAVVAQYNVRNETIEDNWPWQDDGTPPPAADEPYLHYPFYARDRRMTTVVSDAGGEVLLSGVGSDQYIAGNLYFLADLVATVKLATAVREIGHWAVAQRKSAWRVGARWAIYPLLSTRLRAAHAPRGEGVPRWIRNDRSSVRDELPNVVRQLEGPWGRKFAGAVAFEIDALPAQLTRRPFEMDVEMRYPFLYKPLVEFTLRLPPMARTRPLANKWILREAMRGILPEQVRTRTGKGGIGARVRWALARESELIHGLLHEPILADLGCIDPMRFAKSVGRLRQGRGGRSRHIFAALSLETWLRVRSGRWAALRDQSREQRQPVVALSC
jgi:asparagine synthase (glutamine-hydrolysing)